MGLRRLGLLVLVVVLVAIAFAAGSMSHADSVETQRTLLADGADLVVDDCANPFDGSAVVSFPAGSFDEDSVIHVTTSDEDGWSSGGGDTWATFQAVVRVHVPAAAPKGLHRVAVTATGTYQGHPVEMRDTLSVSVRCVAR